MVIHIPPLEETLIQTKQKPWRKPQQNSVYTKTHEQEEDCEEEVLIPPHFRCPISLDLMRDPVTLTTGQTYDRASIEEWFAAGNATCPSTRQPLLDLTLLPNITLRNLIKAWCHTHSVATIPAPPIDRATIKNLISSIASASAVGSAAPVGGSLARIHAVAKSSSANRVIIAEEGGPDALAALILSFSECEDLTDTILSAASLAISTLLILLPPCASRIPECLTATSALRFTSQLLRHPITRLPAAALLQRLTTSDTLARQLADMPTIFHSLSSLLSVHPKLAVRTLFALCLSSPASWHRAAATSAPARLIDALPALDRRDAQMAAATLDLLCKTAEGREAVAGHAMAVPVLKKMVLKISDQTSECAAGVLLAIALHSPKAQCEAVEEGVFTQVLLLLQSQCTARAKKKARCLLKLLQDNWPDHPCVKLLGISGLAPF